MIPKFRAWDPEVGKMYDVQNICFHGNPMVTLQFGPVIKKQLVDLALMQFTGLKDKNGVEIYEGDILYYAGDSCRHCKKVLWEESMGNYVVKWDTVCAQFVFASADNWLTTTMANELEVIGNIYANPELLEQS